MLFLQNIRQVKPFYFKQICNMKNKFLSIILLTTTIICLASCAGSRAGYGNHRKGYGCPATVTTHTPPSEKI
jgi:hypothetical protein